LALAGDGESRLAIDIVDRTLPAGPVLRARTIAPQVAPVPVPRRTATESERTAADDSASVPSSTLSEEPVEPRMAEARDRLILQLQRAAEAGMIDLASPLPEVEDPTVMAAAEAAQLTPEAPETPEDPPVDGAITETRPTDPPTPSETRTAAAATPSATETGPPAVTTASRSDPDGEPTVEGAADGPAMTSAFDADPETDIDTGVEVSEVAAKPMIALECYGPEVLALMPEDAGFAARLSELRSDLLGEFDRPNRDAVEALARHYLAHGLGFEARALMTSLLPEDALTPVLASLGTAIEGAPLPDEHALSKSDCTGEQAAWQALIAHQRGDVAGVLDAAERSGRAIEAMAEPHRSRIAVAIAHAAADADRWSMVRAQQMIARRGDRRGELADGQRVLLDARIAEHDGNLDRAVDLYRRLWSRGGDAGADAMIRIARLVTEEGMADPGDTLLLRLDLGAAAFAYRGTPRGAAAVIAEAELRAAAFGRIEALDLLALARSDGTLDAEEHTAAVERLTLDPAIDPGEEPLAILVERAPDRFAGALREPGFRVALARSYMDLGLPDRAEDQLESGDLADGMLAAELGEAYLAAGRPGDAERLALLVRDPERRAVIQAEALGARGQPAQGLETLLLADAGDPELRARLAWEAEDWPEAVRALDDAVATEPTPDLTARLALAMRRAGVGDASDGLAAGDPRLSTAMAELATDNQSDFVATPENVARLLEELRSETDAIRELLEDG
ncbi:MAG: hypothetical protein AAGC57_12950, partial [Pseudomonadota bacterium]